MSKSPSSVSEKSSANPMGEQLERQVTEPKSEVQQPKSELQPKSPPMATGPPRDANAEAISKTGFLRIGPCTVASLCFYAAIRKQSTSGNPISI